MTAGTAIGIVNCGLRTTIDVNTSTVTRAVYLVITEAGIGLTMNLPYTALVALVQECDSQYAHLQIGKHNPMLATGA